MVLILLAIKRITFYFYFYFQLFKSQSFAGDFSFQNVGSSLKLPNYNIFLEKSSVFPSFLSRNMVFS